MRTVIILLFALCAAILPAAALAQDETEDHDDFNLKINGDYTVPANETIGTLVVIRGDVRVAGRVDDGLLVINGDVLVSGSVGGDITVIDGDLTVAGGATVNDVSLVRGELNEQPGSRITGDVSERSDFFSRGAALAFGIFLWVGFTVALLIGGLLFATIGGRQLMGSAALMTQRTGATILAAVITVIALPAVAVIAMLTIVGIPAGIGVLLFLIPALAFLGYLVAGALLGRLILGGFGERGRPVNALPAVVLGVVILQLALVIPVLGVISFLVGLWGTGALVFFALRGARPTTRGGEPVPAAGAPGPTEPAS